MGKMPVQTPSQEKASYHQWTAQALELPTGALAQETLLEFLAPDGQAASAGLQSEAWDSTTRLR